MGDWDQGLFGCLGDINALIFSYFIPCFAAGKIGEYLGEDMIKVAVGYCCLSTLVHWRLRFQLREKMGIKGTEIDDLIMVALCGSCTLCQEYHEVLKKGGAIATETMER
eukprot:TRINITY_DN432090_c1_g1_i1.p1 TRINITY_DN432090_c1_g1~~TRINITY_DN432090_c1_g1_i1.p1  ORF type:complete len:109 (-),score=12.35 TRINITY_DN432090_c1_g1_i1:172-498(-)